MEATIGIGDTVWPATAISDTGTDVDGAISDTGADVDGPAISNGDTSWREVSRQKHWQYRL